VGKPAISKTGIYVHIPFCAAICNYCNFNRGLHDPGLRVRYVDALVTDIRRAADPSIAADTIFFGGGTPSLLAPSELRPDHSGLPRVLRPGVRCGSDRGSQSGIRDRRDPRRLSSGGCQSS
jgi:coproporphyrinogen III oxidase-like Fe-S oxidoreductase